MEFAGLSSLSSRPMLSPFTAYNQTAYALSVQGSNLRKSNAPTNHSSVRKLKPFPSSEKRSPWQGRIAVESGRDRK
jgi:hypothetical protein